MTLGELIDNLRSLPPTAEVKFDFGAVPTNLCSWRGVYAQLTLDSATADEGPTVRQVLTDAENAVGGTFKGYKGGDFTMDRGTAVWADEYGIYTGRMLLAAVLSGETVVLKTLVRPQEYSY